jgi:hypothetical protein
MPELPTSEVKGVWFVAARDYALEVHGQALLDQLVERTPPKYRDVYRAPIASAWYPEEALQEALSMLHEIVAQENDFMFEQIMEGCTEQGINRLFQMLLRMSSPGFVLRMVPTMWRQIRRGAGHVDVEQFAGHTLLRYSEFPWFEDRLYRLLTVGSLRAIVRYCTRRDPRIDLIEERGNALTVRVSYRAEELYPAPGRHVSTRKASGSVRLPASEPATRSQPILRRNDARLREQPRVKVKRAR